MRNGVNLLHGYGHDAPPVVVSWQHHSGEQSQTTAGSSSSEKNRVVQPSPLNVRSSVALNSGSSWLRGTGSKRTIRLLRSNHTGPCQAFVQNLASSHGKSSIL